jgi:hypothetical protein
MAGYLPRTEGELYQQRPFVSQQNVFPREDLLGQEKVLFEARPRFFSYSPIAIGFSFAWMILMAMVIAVSPMFEWPAFVVVIIFFDIPLFYAIYSWRTTAYVLTSQRAVKRSGSSLDSASWSSIADVRLAGHSSKIIFSVSSSPQVPGSPQRPGVTSKIKWKAVPGASAVASFAKSALLFYGMQGREMELRQKVVITSTLEKIHCDYCGCFMSLDQLDQRNPCCPRCAAPILVV